MKPIRILIGCPTAAVKDYCLAEYVECLKKLKAPAGCELSFMIVDTSVGDSYYLRLSGISNKLILRKITPLEMDRRNRDSIIEGRNIIRDFCLAKNFDYLFSLEQDVMAQPESLKRLLAANKDIISAIYLYPGGNPILWKSTRTPGKGKLCTLSDIVYRGNNLMQVEQTGLGCLLISRKVLEKIKFRYHAGEEAYDDHYFCKDAKVLGFDLWAHCGVRLDHIGHVYNNGRRIVLEARWN